MTDTLIQRITDYLSGGGLFNPELANHEAVRDLLIDCRDALEQQAAQVEALRGQHAVLVRLLVEADKVLGTIDGESQEEWDMLLQLRRCITAATMPHRPEDADLLSIRERLGC